MQVEIDRSKCIGAGMCLGIAPELFSLDAEGKAVVAVGEIDADGTAKIEAAVVCCPVEAISAG